MRRIINVSNIRKLILFVDNNKKVISLVFATALAMVGTEQVTDGAVSDTIAKNVAFVRSANASLN